MNMINKIFAIIFAVTVSTQSVAALNNPFNKVSNVHVGSDVGWIIDQGSVNKTSTVSDNDGIFYRLILSQTELSLRLMDSSSGKDANALTFEQLTIEDIQLDSKTSTLFNWCLNNQQSHNRYLQQGSKVKKGICQNRGGEGLFVMKLNQATYDLLKKTSNITFVIKPYRKTAIVSFDVSELSNLFARLSGAKVPASVAKRMTVPKPAMAAKSVVVAKKLSRFLSRPAANVVPVANAKTKTVKVCKLKPPAGFSSIKTVNYKCDDVAAKNSARKKLAVEIRKIKAQNEKLALARQKHSKQARAKNLELEEDKRREAEAIAAIERQTIRIRNEVSEKMIGMCRKKWAEGKHRCYCEPYLEFAPAGIKSDASCADS